MISKKLERQTKSQKYLTTREPLALAVHLIKIHPYQTLVDDNNSEQRKKPKFDQDLALTYRFFHQNV